MSNHTDILYHLRSWRIRTALVISCLLMSGVSAYAGIALELKAPKGVYLLDEPIYATVTLHNTGKIDAKVFKFLELGHDTLKVIITSPDGETYRLNSIIDYSMVSGSIMGGIIRLYPDKSFGNMLEIMNWSVTKCDSATGISEPNVKTMMHKSDKKSYQKAFEKPGKYIIRCVYTPYIGFGLDPTPVYSNKLIVRIDAPEGDDLLVYKRLLQGSEKLPFGVWDIGHERIPLYEELLAKYPKSAYAVYMKFYLAQSLESHAEIRLRGTESCFSTFKKSAEICSQAADESVGSPMSPYFMRIAGRTFAKIGDNEKAMALMIASFTSKDSTEQDRLEILSWLKHIESGMFHMESGVTTSADKYTVWVPFKSFASSMGYTVRVTGGLVNLFYANLTAVLDTSKCTLTFKDGKPMKVRVRIDDERVLAAPEVIGRLMAAKYGKEDSTSFKHLIDGPKLP